MQFRDAQVGHPRDCCTPVKGIPLVSSKVSLTSYQTCVDGRVLGGMQFGHSCAGAVLGVV